MRTAVRHAIVALLGLSLITGTAEADDIDVIVVLDNSGSMATEANQLQSSLNAFVAQLSGGGNSVRIIAISASSNESEGLCAPAPLGSGSCPSDQNLPGYRHVVQTVGSTNALSFVLSQHPAYASSLRPGSDRHILVVTDDDSSLSAASFTSQLIALDGDFTGFRLHAIAAAAVAPPVPPSRCAQAEAGQVYGDLASQSGGTFEDLCDEQLALSMTIIGSAIAPAPIAALPEAWSGRAALGLLMLLPLLALSRKERA